MAGLAVAALTFDQALAQGIEAHKAGEVQEADRLYTAILKAQPKHPDANHNMGLLAVGVGKVEKALPFFKTALEANPAAAQFWLSYIDALIKLDKLAGAKAVLDQAKSRGAKGDGFDKLEQRLQQARRDSLETSKIPAEVPPPQPNILDSLKLDQAIKIAKKKSKDGSTEEARRIYQDILTKFPKNKRASYGLKGLADKTVGKASKVQDPPQDQLQSLVNLYSQGQLQLALKQAETLVQQFPQSPVLFNIQGAVLKGLGQLDLSIQAYNKALAIKPDYAEAYNNMGNALKEQGKMEGAIEAYNKALAIKPDYAEAHYNMGNVLQEQGKLEEAIGAYNKTLAIKPDYAEAHYNVGNALQEQGKLEEAIEAYNKTLAIKPDYAEAYNNMGNALKEQGKLEEAIEAYNKTLAIKPDYAEAYNNMGNALKEQGKLEEAIEAYNKTLAIKPDYAEAYNNMGNALKEQGKLEEAMEAYNKTLAIKPDYADAYNNMGVTLKEQGKLEKAIEAYSKALAIKPDYAEAYNNMGNALKEQGKMEGAIEAYNKALAIKPDYVDAQTNLATLLFEGRLYEKAGEIFALDSSSKSQSNLLKCFYELDEKSKFAKQLDYLIARGENNALIGSYLSRSKVSFGIKKNNPFCNNPLNYVSKVDLNKECDFKKIFVENAANILSNDEVKHKSQGHLTNGIQTAGNIFTQVGSVTDQWKKIIHTELKKYKDRFRESEEGLIRDWPSDFELFGWLVSMNNGGELSAHIHETGWVTGSIYINVPPKSKKDSGNLVVTTHDSKHGDGKAKDTKSIDVVTGSLCLFPSSLLHYTIPFESDDDRIVLAFDIMPKK